MKLFVLLLALWPLAASAQTIDDCVPPPPPPPGVLTPTATLRASPLTVWDHGQTLLTWASTNATSCIGSNFNTNGAKSGIARAYPTLRYTTYSVTCIGEGGSVKVSVQVRRKGN